MDIISPTQHVDSISIYEEDALMALQKDLDSLVLPQVPKAQLRDRLGELRKQPPALMLCV